jgi:periplasmic protein TonB
MSAHFSVSLGLIIACGVHVFIFLNLDINQNIKILKKEKTLSIVLNKIPEKKTVLEMPVSVPSIIEKIEQAETPVQKSITPSKKTKGKKTHKKQESKKKKPKKDIVENVELPKNNVNVDEQLEMPTENANVISEKPAVQETQDQKIKEIKTVSCANYSHCPKPQYPFVAKQRNIEGWVKLALKINETGKVINAKILASEPEDMFEEAALEAVLQWENLPEQLFNSTFEQKIEFKLNN